MCVCVHVCVVCGAHTCMRVCMCMCSHICVCFACVHECVCGGWVGGCVCVCVLCMCSDVWVWGGTCTFMCSHVCVARAATIVQDSWCWRNKTVELEVGEGDVTGVAFTHNGYILKCSISHPITLVGHSPHLPACLSQCLHACLRLQASLYDTLLHPLP